uniref:Enoyl-CoA hydratase domain-containing protein 3, mitochondrial n=1 Tax=Romanomermis culicivorax TaxID=13658 RepID=A0A915IMC6_ROMCU
MLQAINERIQEAQNEKEARVIILSSQPPVFSAGHDLKELTTSKGKSFHEKVFAECTKLMTMLRGSRLPIIAEVKSLAAAAGCQLVASCDIVVAGHSAKFATPGARAGIFCSTPGVAIARSVPRKVAMDMLLVGDPISAQEALRVGLVSRVVPDEDVEKIALDIATKICSLSKPVIELGKKFFNEQVDLTVQDAYRKAEKVMVENLRLIDAQEGLKAFIEKRVPSWTHDSETCH